MRLPAKVHALLAITVPARRAGVLWTFLIVGGCGLALGQGLVGVGLLPGQSTVQVFAIHPATGGTTPFLSTGAGALTGAPIGFDPLTRRLFFEDGSGLWTADLALGTSTRVPLSVCCPFLQYDRRANLLLGLGLLPGQTTVQVFAIDPASGGTTPLLSTGASALSGAPIGFDPLTRRLFFEDGSGLWTADLELGTATRVPLAVCCPYLQYDGRANLLLGLGLLPGQTTVQVFAIDPATGDTTPLLSTGASALTAAPIGFDPLARRLFFEDGSELWTADLELGTATHVPLAVCCPALHFAGGAVAAVPLLGPSGLAALLIGIAIAGWHFSRAQRS